MGVVQSSPSHPFSHVQMSGSVQLPRLGHSRYCTFTSSPAWFTPSTVELMPHVLVMSFTDCLHTGMLQSAPSHPSGQMHCARVRRGEGVG